MKRFNKVVEEMKQINILVGNIPNFVEECFKHFNNKVRIDYYILIKDQNTKLCLYGKF